MTDPLMMFQEGGVTMYLVLMALVIGAPGVTLALALAVASRFKHVLLWPARALAVVMVLWSASPTLIGAAGWVQGRATTDTAIEAASPEVREELMTYGYALAAYPLKFGGLGSALLIVPAMMALVIALPRPKEG